MVSSSKSKLSQIKVIQFSLVLVLIFLLPTFTKCQDYGNMEELLNLFKDEDLDDLEKEELKKQAKLDVHKMLTTGMASESLEFLIRQYKGVVNAEEQLDKLLEDFHLAEKETRNQRRWEEEHLKVKMLADRAQSLVTKARQGRILRDELKDEILEIKIARDKLNAEWDPSKNISTHTDIVEFEKQKTKVHMQIDKVSEMREDYARYFMLFLAETGIELVDAELGENRYGFKGENVPFDIQIIEKLYKKYQQLEARKAKLEEIEKDENAFDLKKKEIEDEIELLEKKVIPKYVKENEDKIRLFMHSNAGVMTRGIEKMRKVDVMYNELSQQIQDSVEFLKLHKIEVKRLIDGMEEAAAAWFDMKSESKKKTVKSKEEL